MEAFHFNEIAKPQSNLRDILPWKSFPRTSKFSKSKAIRKAYLINSREVRLRHAASKFRWQGCSCSTRDWGTEVFGVLCLRQEQKSWRHCSPCPLWGPSCLPTCHYWHAVYLQGHPLQAKEASEKEVILRSPPGAVGPGELALLEDSGERWILKGEKEWPSSLGRQGQDRCEFRKVEKRVLGARVDRWKWERNERKSRW